MRGVEGPTLLTQLLVANYAFVEKAEDGEESWLKDWEPEIDGILARYRRPAGMGAA